MAKIKYVRGERPPPPANWIPVVLSGTPALGASPPDGPGPDSSAQLWPAHALLGTAWDGFCVLPVMGKKKTTKKQKSQKKIMQLISVHQARVQIIILQASTSLRLDKQRGSESRTL